MEAGRIKRKSGNFTVVPNEALKRTDLSFRAKGLLAFLLSLHPEWKLYKETLPQYSTEKRDAIRTAFKELTEAGYISQKIVRNKEGHFKGYEYEVSEAPIFEKPISDNQTLIKTTKEIKTNKKSKPKKEKAEPVKKADPEKVLDLVRSYAANVKMTDTQHEKLIERMGKEGAEWCINKLNNYKLASGKKYKSDYHAILTWVESEYIKTKGLVGNKLSIGQAGNAKNVGDGYKFK